MSEMDEGPWKLESAPPMALNCGCYFRFGHGKIQCIFQKDNSNCCEVDEMKGREAGGPRDQVHAISVVRAGKGEVLDQGSKNEEGGWIPVPF